VNDKKDSRREQQTFSELNRHRALLLTQKRIMQYCEYQPTKRLKAAKKAPEGAFESALYPGLKDST
jgi:hypothetical protein